MYTKTKIVLAFGAGLLTGAAAAFFPIKRYYQQITDRDIASIKEMYKVKNEMIPDEGQRNVNPAPKPMKNAEYGDMVKDLGYSTPLSNSSPKPTYEPETILHCSPFVISPDIFGDDEEYGRESLTWYADCVLTDECDEILSDEEISEMVGIDSLSHFGEYESDAVYVQNDELKMYYEILLDSTNYHDRHHTPPFEYTLVPEEEEG